MADVLAAVNGPPEAAARALLGAVITDGAVGVRLTEVEAYGGPGEDPASHAHNGLTHRNRSMFGPAGCAYAYHSYGVHWCLNVVCGPEGSGSAVLLRSGEVIAGLELARVRRGAVIDRDLARGPGRLGQVLAVTADDDGCDLSRGRLRLLSGSFSGAVVSGPRVGVSKEAERPWRFWIAEDYFVSPYRPGRRTPTAAPKRSV